MATGTGLDAYLGTKTEVTPGVLLAPTYFWPFNTAELTYDPSFIENSGIMNGARFKDVSQTGIARKSASGKIQIPVMMNGFGWWMKHILGSNGTLANPALDATPAYKQVHVPGGLRGLSFTTQIGKPMYDGTVKIRTYPGCKVTDWTLTFADNAITTLDLQVDAWLEDQTQSLPSVLYPAQPMGSAGVAGGAYNFSHVSAFKTINNDALTAVTAASSIMSMSASAVAVPSVVTKLTLTGKATLATDRYGLGNAGTKKEQLETDFFDISGAFEAEYDATTWETPFINGSTIAIQITSTGPQIATTGKFNTLDIIIPAAKITKAPAPVSGPDIVKVSGEFSVYDPKQGSGATLVSPIQIMLESTDLAAWT